MIEARVTRLYGHSSSSGATRVRNEPDCIDLFEKRMLQAAIIDAAGIERVHQDAQAEAEAATDQVRSEPDPAPDDLYLHTYADSPVDAVYPRDYTGLPGSDANR
jgi:2-oxoisovalerate dehydrogenase E1 component alpha subunit